MQALSQSLQSPSPHPNPWQLLPRPMSPLPQPSPSDPAAVMSAASSSSVLPHPLSTACIRALSDKTHEKRKTAANEIEKYVRQSKQADLYLCVCHTCGTYRVNAKLCLQDGQGTCPGEQLRPDGAPDRRPHEGLCQRKESEREEGGTHRPRLRRHWTQRGAE